MPRTLGIVQTSIWVDEDFRALSVEAQRAYILVFSQPKITNCGVVAYLPRRLSRLAADDSVDRLERAVEELEAARFVVVDRDTDELLVRTFMRHDRVERVEKMRLAALREFREIESPAIRFVLREENPGVFDHIPEPRPLGQGVIEGVDQPVSQGVTEGVSEGASHRGRPRAKTSPSPAPAPSPAPGAVSRNVSGSTPREANGEARLPFENERVTIELLSEIGDAGDEDTPDVVRAYAAKLPEGSIAKVLESLRSAKPKDRAAYVVGALKSELAERQPPPPEEPRSQVLRSDPERFVREHGFQLEPEQLEHLLGAHVADEDERIRLADLAADLRAEVRA